MKLKNLILASGMASILAGCQTTRLESGFLEADDEVFICERKINNKDDAVISICLRERETARILACYQPSTGEYRYYNSLGLPDKNPSIQTVYLLKECIGL